MTNTCPIFSKHLAQTDHFVKLTNKSILSQYNKSSCSFISEAFHTASRKYSGHKIIYTDCAKGEQWCGCAILYRNNVVRCLLSEMFSVLTAKLYASLHIIEIAISVPEKQHSHLYGLAQFYSLSQEYIQATTSFSWEKFLLMLYPIKKK